MPFLPQLPARVLDAGAGAGQNAAAMAEMGHQVFAVEPLQPFLAAGQSNYPQSRVTWIEDALPYLECFAGHGAQFDFVLVNGVWHHLDEVEQQQALARLEFLMADGACLALTLRNGPAGAGSHVFAMDGKRTVQQAREYGLVPELFLPDQPSYMPGKESVHWTFLLLRKPL